MEEQNEKQNEKPKWWQENWFDEALNVFFERFKKIGIMLSAIILASLVPIKCSQSIKSGDKGVIDAFYDSATEFVATVGTIANSEEAPEIDDGERTVVETPVTFPVEKLKEKYDEFPKDETCTNCGNHRYWSYKEISDVDFGSVYIVLCDECEKKYLDMYYYK